MMSWRLTTLWGSCGRGRCNRKAHAFGVDDTACLFARGQIVFFVWVSLNEQKWVTLAERRSRMARKLNLLNTVMMGVCGIDNLWDSMRTVSIHSGFF
jgi:hypothetical protein